MLHVRPAGTAHFIAAIALCATAWCQAGAILFPAPAAAQQAMTAGAPVEANKALIRRFIEDVHNKGNFALFNELFAPNYVNHSAPAKENGRAAREQAIRSYRAAAPDLRVTIDDMIAEGDKVALRWTTHGTERGPLHTPLGIAPATERPISIPGVNIFRIVNGQIAEEWIVWDTLSWAQQLGFQMRQP
jgi:steroid delta-isomerase-like uncharacterized protein